MKYMVISNYLAVFIITYNCVHIYCTTFEYDPRLLSTSDNPRRLLKHGLIDDKDSEAHCMYEHMKCLDEHPKYKIIGAWDIFNSKWKFHTICEIKNSRCVLNKAAYRYNNSGYNTWILV